MACAALCTGCHKELAQVWVVPHAPVKGAKGCMTCHPPHAAANGMRASATSEIA